MTSLINSIKNLAKQTGEDTRLRFSVSPSPAAGAGDCGFAQWQSGMRMVARLPEGIPHQFRKTLWLTLAEKHLAGRGVQWQQVEEFCFNEFTNPDDEELGVQIVKDVHRTGCSLFCGVSGKDNQALLKRVLLAYARWNKAVGYCQGFNMLAALILQVMDKSEVDSVKVMIFLIEGVLPESYFANNLRGLSVDMAVFRDLLRLKLPTLSRHFDQLQCDSKDSGTSYEPPLTNVFTMQWFLTLFCNCLPQDTVLRVWDLIFLEGNHILLCTALAIWSTLSDRILSVESADEFYCIMGVLTREMLEFGLMDANALIKAIVSFNLPELGELREKYLYNITPWTQSVSTVARRGLRLFYSDDDTDTDEDDEKIAIATAYGLFRSPKKKDGASGVTSPPRALTCPDKDKIAMDISALTKQYRKLRERQKQAHVILTAACGSQGLVGPTASPAMNHLLMGKFALVNSKGRRLGPPPGAVPPPTFLAKPRVSSPSSERKTRVISGETLHWKDALDQSGQKKDDGDQSPEVDSRASSRRGSVSSSSTSTELCDDPQRMSDSEDLTNSLSEPPDRSQPSTPRIQPKILHSIDLDSCKEDPENKEEEESPNIQCDEVDQLREEIASISSISPGDDERPHRRKPSSFRIDPEELRQLDRKLSLKIVEIERRKSNAGIESEDLNSKVLFPFDRDYLGDGDNPERADSPSSIPDDRLCCMEDFDDECIPVPDLITTHKPINFRMSSLEECDETKLSDVDPHKMSFKEPGDDVDEELESLHESDEMSDEEYEQDECQNSSDYSKFNFDDLFPAKEDESNECYEQHNLADNFQNKTLTDCESDQPCSAISEFDTNTPNINFSTQNDLESHKSHSNDLSLSSRNQNGYETHLFMNIMSCNENKELNNATNAVIISDESSKTNGPTLKSDEIINIRNYELRKSDNEGQEGNLNNDAGSVLDDKKFNESSSLDGSTLHFLSRDKNVENLKTDEEDMTSKLLSYQTLATDSEKSCKVKVKFDIRSSLALSNALPDVTSVSSSDFDIDSIRKKYANFGQLSYERPAFESLDVKTSELNGCKDTTETVVVNKEDNQSLLGTAIRADLKPILDIEQTDVCGTLDHVQSTEGLPVISSEQSITNTRQSSITSDSNNHMDSSVSDVHDREDHTDVIMSDLRLRDVENIPQQSSPSRRRGSEVALNLILKENSQILTKIQQQSRRSSDVWVDSKSMNENETSDILDQLNDLRMGAELRSLNNVILETLEGSGESKLVPSESIIEKKKDIHETDQINCSNTNLNEQKYQNQQDSLVEKHDSKTVNKPCDVDDAESFTKTDKLRKEIKGKTLPDVCKYDYEYIKQSRPGGEYALTATSNKDTQLENNDSKSDITTKTNHDCFTTKLDINTYTPPKTTYSVKKSEKSIKDIENYTDEYNFDKLSSQNSSEPKYLINIQNTPRGIFSPIDDQNEAQDKSGLSSPAIGKTQKASDANEDIIKELRYLDIKPEETLDYSTTKKTPLSTPNLEDHLTSLEKNLSSVTSEDYTPTKGYHGESYTSGNNSKVTVEKFVSLKSHYNGKENSMENMTTDKLDDFILSKKYSLANEDEELAHSSNSGRSRSMLQKNYMHHKSASVDVVSHDKLTTEPDKPKGSFVRSATTVEDDDSMYMNSYKSHGRLLIEKGELKTHRRSDEELRKSTDTFNRSAYDFKKASGSDGINLTYSRFSSETSKLPETSYVRPTEKMLFRYKSEDHGIGTTPLRCRFSSASPIRTRLDSFSADTDFRSSSAVNRTKSPSPTLYRSSPVAERLVSGRLDSSGSDYSHSSKDYPRYSRTESLDSSSSSRPTGHLRRKTESLDSFTEEKKITSPQSPVKFNPFPVRSLSRQPKDLGVKLGLYLPSKADKSPTKRLT